MNRRYLRKSAMYKAVKDTVRDANPATLAQMPQMDAALSQLEHNLERINEYGKDQSENRKGIAADKEVTKEQVANTCFILAGKIRSFAVNSGNLILRDSMNFTLSTLQRMPDEDIVDAAELITQRADENIGDLADYGVTPASLAATINLVNSFNDKIAKPREGITQRKNATNDLKQIFKNTDTLLEDTMDTFVIIVKETDSVFYKTYQSNRIIVDPATIPLAMRCFVTDEEQNPLQNVTITIEGYTKKHKTSAKGKIHIKSLPSGIHAVTCSKFGYITQVLSVPINKGERTDLRVVLKQNP